MKKLLFTSIAFTFTLFSCSSNKNFKKYYKAYYEHKQVVKAIEKQDIMMIDYKDYPKYQNEFIAMTKSEKGLLPMAAIAGCVSGNMDQSYKLYKEAHSYLKLDTQYISSIPVPCQSILRKVVNEKCDFCDSKVRQDLVDTIRRIHFLDQAIRGSHLYKQHYPVQNVYDSLNHQTFSLHLDEYIDQYNCLMYHPKFNKSELIDFSVLYGHNPRAKADKLLPVIFQACYDKKLPWSVIERINGQRIFKYHKDTLGNRRLYVLENIYFDKSNNIDITHSLLELKSFVRLLSTNPQMNLTFFVKEKEDLPKIEAIKNWFAEEKITAKCEVGNYKDIMMGYTLH